MSISETKNSEKNLAWPASRRAVASGRVAHAPALPAAPLVGGLLSALALGLLCAPALRADGEADGQAEVARDPFWPIGYKPKPAPAVVVEQDEAAAEPAEEVSEEDWSRAEKALGINPQRYSIGKRSDGVQFVAISGNILTKGSIVNHVQNGVRFEWLLEVEEGVVGFRRTRAMFWPPRQSERNP